MSVFRILFPGLFLLGLIAFLAMYWGRISSPTPISVNEQAILDESMKGVQALRFDKQGNLIQILTMQAGWHHKGESVTHMVAPYLKIIQSNGALWDISAKTGESIQNTLGGKIQQLRLSEDVIVQQVITGSASKKDFWWKLKTPNLLFIEENALALTEDPVIIQTLGSETRAVGMRAHLDHHYVELLNHVDTHYAKS